MTFAMDAFTITQFFQVLKLKGNYQRKLSSFTITQFFQVLKREVLDEQAADAFTITQFFQVLKLNNRRWGKHQLLR